MKEIDFIIRNSK